MSRKHVERYLSIDRQFFNRKKLDYFIFDSEKFPYNGSFTLLFDPALEKFLYSLFGCGLCTYERKK